MTKSYTNSQITELINEHVHSERDREILRLRFVDGCTYAAIADKIFERFKIPISTRRISTLIGTYADILERLI